MKKEDHKRVIDYNVPTQGGGIGFFGHGVDDIVESRCIGCGHDELCMRKPNIGLSRLILISLGQRIMAGNVNAKLPNRVESPRVQKLAESRNGRYDVISGRLRHRRKDSVSAYVILVP